MNRSNWPAVFFLWEIMGLGVSLAISLPRGDFHEFIHYLLLGLTVTNAIGLSGFIAFAAFQKIFKRADTSTAVHIVFIIILILLVAPAGTAIAFFVVDSICNLATVHSADEGHILFLITNLIFSVLIAGAGIFYLLLEKSRVKIEKEIAEIESLKRLQSESKLAVLQTRLNPHFLFNTLNAMLSMVYDSPQNLESMILNLSAIYRKVLTLPENTFITIEEELRLVREYLEIEKIRLAGKLDFEISAEARILNFKIPPFIIETVVENAVNHSIFMNKKGGKIFIGVHRVAETVFIHIRENGIGFMRKQGGNGFGIFNIRQLLKLLYGENARFNTASLPGGGTQVSMELPWEGAPQLAERMEQPENLVEK